MMGQQVIRRAPQAAEVDAEEDDGEQIGPFLIALGDEVVAQRGFVEMSQATLAERSKCARRTLSLLEQGRRMPATLILWRIARALDLELTDLMEMATERLSGDAPIPHRSGAEAGLV